MCQQCTYHVECLTASVESSKFCRFLIQIHDTTENGALDSSQKVLIDTYDTLELEDGYAVNEVLSFADHVAWAGHAALYRAALNNVGSATRVDEGDVEPDVTVSWGRLSYLNTTVNETGPAETFPATGPGGSGDELIEYFETFFNLTEREVVTLMGVHTFGGGRRSASGYAGMWTQSKNQFNNDYQLQLVFPLPVVCTPGSCTYFSNAGTNKDSLNASNLADMKTCTANSSSEDSERCNGWEQVRMSGLDGAAPKFQWRHSCKHYAEGDPNDVEGCTHLMLNVDMGLYFDLDGHICTAQDETDGIVATLNRTCKEGMIKSYSDSTCESNKGTQRVLASCFDLRTNSSDYIIEDAGDYEGWMADFAPLFDMILSYNLTANSTLTTLTQPEPSAAPSPSPSDVPSVSPSETPSAAPSPLRSESPSLAPTVCEDDSRWKYVFSVDQDGNKTYKRCKRIAKLLADGNSTACSVTSEDGISAHDGCRETCATCTS